MFKTIELGNLVFYFMSEEAYQKAIKDDQQMLNYADIVIDTSNDVFLKSRYSLREYVGAFMSKRTEQDLGYECRYERNRLASLILHIRTKLSEGSVAPEWLDYIDDKITESVILPAGTSLTEEYMRLSEELLVAQHEGSEEDEDAIMDKMDPIWWKMSDNERRRVEILATKLLYDRGEL